MSHDFHSFVFARMKEIEEEARKPEADKKWFKYDWKYASLVLFFETIILTLCFIIDGLCFRCPFKLIFFSLLGRFDDKISPIDFVENQKIGNSVKSTGEGRP